MNRLERLIRWPVVIWTFGGGPERILLIVLGVTLFLFLPGLLIWLFVNAWTLEVPFAFGATVVLAMINFLALVDLFGFAVYTRDSYQEWLRLIQLSASDEAAANEILAYFRPHGDRYRLQGAARLASLGWMLCYGLFALSVAFGVFVVPVVGLPTPAVYMVINAPAILAFRRFAGRRSPQVGFRGRAAPSRAIPGPGGAAPEYLPSHAVLAYMQSPILLRQESS